ncbi:MAG: helix-turn-helix domain-containing protein [Rhodoferax sp.]|uniref:helix-turn-helix transcriptional regulator n=1 Tax=Rhodoferax sp. TaxID=50421 RepID=UPI0030187349
MTTLQAHTMFDYQLPALLTKAQVCTRLCIAPRTVEYMVKAGNFPPPVRIGKQVFWSEKSVFSWQQSLFSQQEAWAPA